MDHKISRNNDQDAADECRQRGKFRKEKERERDCGKRLHISQNGGMLGHDLSEGAIIKKRCHC